ncbi:cellulase family glycosylhydrolase [Gilvimarinus sp. SDUM040013]|uniref:Cellulase family glycosylhydrolase n=1 Tax=Gilvimarinus gilvus TaxID=3058038 RepID=A0ABU4S2Z8_9GAMM|nr:cellulase family glycosylhydrolase [Gilvimarinus sp. SDUM040013]MDO3384805.1 cellulase family glycosylhydrolase [Gilvimarinus sp. SDUM040013]MDX6850862.1 cellulase family glycosylhydrolase [Gilvimarinus sp. SDUM040013]
MNVNLPCLALVLVSLLTACSTSPEHKSTQNHGFSSAQESSAEFWNIPYPQSFDTATLVNEQDVLSVAGAKVVDESGNTFVLRGVNIADPAKLAYDNRWDERIFAEVAAWGANVVRIPVHPLGWRRQGKDWYFERIDEAVRWANAHNMYLILDWHIIGNIQSALYQHPMYVTNMDETREFWQSVALRYRGVPTIAVYELLNEPTHDFIGNGAESLGKASWEGLRAIHEELIDLIYVYDKNVIPLVSGFNWAYDLTMVADAPVRREGIAYTIHPYPQKAKPEVKSKENFFALWQETWGYVAENYPVMATELGWVRADGYGAHVPVIHDEGTYGPQIVEFMEARDIAWTAWVFDPDWSPTLINDWDFTPSEQGAFFKKVMTDLNAQ